MIILTLHLLKSPSIVLLSEALGVWPSVCTCCWHPRLLSNKGILSSHQWDSAPRGLCDVASRTFLTTGEVFNLLLPGAVRSLPAKGKTILLNFSLYLSNPSTLGKIQPCENTSHLRNSLGAYFPHSGSRPRQAKCPRISLWSWASYPGSFPESGVQRVPAVCRVRAPYLAHNPSHWC